MVKKSTENGHSIPPFLLKCYDMVDDPATDALISWSKTNDSFIVWNEAEFTSELLPKYFKHNTFASFQRQLNIYGFRKIDTDRWEFSNEGFMKDQKHLLKNISRKKQPQTQQKVSYPKEKEVGVCEENEIAGLWEQVESLKSDKKMLMQELIKQREHQEVSQNKMLVLREKLKGMEKNQQQMLSFIVLAMQNPGFFIHLLQPIENNWCKSDSGKPVLKQVMGDCEISVEPSDGTIVKYQPVTEDSILGHSHLLEFEDSSEPNLTSKEIEDLLMSMEDQDPLVIHDSPNGVDMVDRLLSSTPSSERNSSIGVECEDVACTAVEESLSNSTHDICLDRFEFLTQGFDKFMNMKPDETQGN